MGVKPSNAPETPGAPPDQHQHSRAGAKLVPRVGTRSGHGCCGVNQVHIEGEGPAGGEGMVKLV